MNTKKTTAELCKEDDYSSENKLDLSEFERLLRYLCFDEKPGPENIEPHQDKRMTLYSESSTKSCLRRICCFSLFSSGDAIESSSSPLKKLVCLVHNILKHYHATFWKLNWLSTKAVSSFRRCLWARACKYILPTCRLRFFELVLLKGISHIKSRIGCNFNRILAKKSERRNVWCRAVKNLESVMLCVWFKFWEIQNICSPALQTDANSQKIRRMDDDRSGQDGRGVGIQTS
jgi:hypothetical protein